MTLKRLPTIQFSYSTIYGKYWRAYLRWVGAVIKKFQSIFGPSGYQREAGNLKFEMNFFFTLTQSLVKVLKKFEGWSLGSFHSEIPNFFNTFIKDFSDFQRKYFYCGQSQKEQQDFLNIMFSKICSFVIKSNSWAIE